MPNDHMPLQAANFGRWLNISIKSSSPSSSGLWIIAEDSIDWLGLGSGSGAAAKI